MNLMQMLAFTLLSVLYVWTMYNLPILAIGVKRLRGSRRSEKKTAKRTTTALPKISIIVPVRGEERVIGRLLEALWRLDYPPEKREIVIVEDGSVDKTVGICEEYVRCHPDQVKLVRKPSSNGKPAALNHALNFVTGELVAVFDADNVPERDVLVKVVRYFEDPSTVAVQGRLSAINADENMLTKFISHEEGVRYETYLRGKDAWNLFVTLTGSCYFVKRKTLKEIDGWNGEALSEDMELSARLAEEGYRIRYAPDVRSWQENPESLTQFFKQRTRWFRGCMEVSLRYGRLVKTIDRRCIDAEVTLLGPFMLIPALLSYVLGIYPFLKLVQPSSLLTFMAHGAMLLTTITLFLIGLSLLYLTKPRNRKNLFWLPFVYGYWIIQTLIAFYAVLQITFKRPRRWTKTMKTGTVTKKLKDIIS